LVLVSCHGGANTTSSDALQHVLKNCNNFTDLFALKLGFSFIDFGADVPELL